MKNLLKLYNQDVTINEVKTNSQDINENDLFACIKGVNVDRHGFIGDAIKCGASFLIVSKGSNYSVPYVKVRNVERELVKLLKYVYDDYSKIDLIGVTGTDGKTTTASIIRDMLTPDDCAYMGTVGVSGKNWKEDIKNTTPAIETIYYYLDRFAKEGYKYLSMEVSSEGLYRKRLEGLKFKRAIITNVTEDHLNIHKTMENYIGCKRMLFNKLDKDGIAILNRDDLHYDKFKNVNRKKLTYGENKYSDLRIVSYELKEDSTTINYRYKKKDYLVESPLVGKFNAYNLSAALLTMLSLGYTFDECINKLVKRVKRPQGRVDYLDYGTDYKVLIDYAHTENSIKELLTFLNAVKKNRIITVTGAAGGREKENRPRKGKILQELSDVVVYTMDDPRYESVREIIDMMIDRSKDNYIIEEDRVKAIAKALDMAKKDDIVAIIGKGSDTYMAIEDRKDYFSDFDEVDKYFKNKK